MARSRDKNNDETLRGLLRQAKSENKHLRRQVARLEKQLARLPIDEPEEESTVTEFHIIDPEDSCPKCGKEMKRLDLGIKVILSCSCGHRLTLKE
jgi:chromosome segregation ATPase